jgi:hypothetical protein
VASFMLLEGIRLRLVEQSEIFRWMRCNGVRHGGFLKSIDECEDIFSYNTIRSIRTVMGLH